MVNWAGFTNSWWIYVLLNGFFVLNLGFDWVVVELLGYVVNMTGFTNTGEI